MFLCEYRWLRFLNSWFPSTYRSISRFKVVSYMDSSSAHTRRPEEEVSIKTLDSTREIQIYVPTAATKAFFFLFEFVKLNWVALERDRERENRDRREYALKHT